MDSPRRRPIVVALGVGLLAAVIVWAALAAVGLDGAILPKEVLAAMLGVVAAVEAWDRRTKHND